MRLGRGCLTSSQEAGLQGWAENFHGNALDHGSFPRQASATRSARLAESSCGVYWMEEFFFVANVFFFSHALRLPGPWQKLRKDPFSVKLPW